MFSGGALAETVTSAVADTTLLPPVLNSAVIVDVPALTPVATPLDDIVATAGMEDDHVSAELLVTSSIRPVVPTVASAMKSLVPPEAIDCVLGRMLTAV
jgi:hypothetical protein